jgi:hypothetical protein
MDEKKLTNITKDVLADLSVEELEQRLEMQVLAVAEADYCAGFHCASHQGSA